MYWYEEQRNLLLLLSISESRTPHLSCEESFCNLDMACSGTTLLAFSLSLSFETSQSSMFAQKFQDVTHYSGTLQSRCPSIEHENGLYTIKQELTYPPQESQDVGVHQSAALFVSHGSLKLVDPYTRVDGHRLSLHILEP